MSVERDLAFEFRADRADLGRHRQMEFGVGNLFHAFRSPECSICSTAVSQIASHVCCCGSGMSCSPVISMVRGMLLARIPLYPIRRRAGHMQASVSAGGRRSAHSRASLFSSREAATSARARKLVVLLDFVEPVEVIHHHAARMLHAGLRGVGEPVEPLDARAVAEMEARDRVERLASCFAARQVIRAQRHQQLAQALGGLGVLVPVGRRASEQLRGARRASAPARARARCSSSHARKPGIGESVANVLRRGNSWPSRCATCLISRLPNEMPRRPVLAVGDRVEDRACRRVRDRSAGDPGRAAAAIAVLMRFR